MKAKYRKVLEASLEVVEERRRSNTERSERARGKSERGEAGSLSTLK